MSESIAPPPFHQDPETGETREDLSSLERLLLGLDGPPAPSGPALRSGLPCPNCKLGLLDYDGLLQLECPRCGFVSGEGAGCT